MLSKGTSGTLEQNCTAERMRRSLVEKIRHDCRIMFVCAKSLPTAAYLMRLGLKDIEKTEVGAREDLVSYSIDVNYCHIIHDTF